MTERVRAQRRQLEVRGWEVRGDQARWDSAAARPGSIGVGWERELTGEAHASARGEREDAKDGRCESKKKTYPTEYAKGAHGPSRPTKVMATCEEVGRRGEAGLAGPDPKREFKGK
jgi:hypothetical protein